jgi:ribosomal protein S18 acetylase RimI-like enzyme
MDTIEIIDYKPEHQPHFETLNRAWIEKYFEMEEMDWLVLQHPEKTILKPGGAVLMASYNGIIAGTVALKKINERMYELSKMAVDENYRRKGIAEKLTRAALKKAKQLGATKVILYSQTILIPALSMYRKVGFRDLPLDEERSHKRSDVKMEIELDKIFEPQGT